MSIIDKQQPFASMRDAYLQGLKDGKSHNISDHCPFISQCASYSAGLLRAEPLHLRNSELREYLASIRASLFLLSKTQVDERQQLLIRMAVEGLDGSLAQLDEPGIPITTPTNP